MTMRPISRSGGRLIVVLCLIALGLLFVMGVRPAEASGVNTLASHSARYQQTDDDADKLMLDQPVGELPVVNDARWSSQWTDRTSVAVLAWVAMLVALSIAGRPLTRLAIGSFPDGGRGFSTLLVLLVAGWVVWFLASFDLIEFTAIWSWYAIFAVSVIAWMLSSNTSLGHRPTPSRRAAWGAESAFWLVFALFLAFRFFNPDSWHPIWGGEKPMELAHINALLRTPTFPAFDPWFSDGILNYYYYGEYLVAFLIKLTGIPSEIAFNLAQPTMMGLAAAGMYTVSGALSGRLSRDRVDPLLAGGLGVLIFCLIGNLVSAWDLVHTLPDRPIFTFDWTWAASRAVDGGITEFPYFTGLYADLHAHLIALPVTLAVIAFGLALITGTGSVARSIPLLFFLALGLGTLSAANAWDVPVYGVLAVASVFLWAGRFGNIVIRAIVTAVVSVAVASLAYLLFRPFHEHFVALFNDVGRVSEGTDLDQFALHFGGLLGIIGIAVATSGLLSWSSHRRIWRNVAIAVFCLAVMAGIAWQVLQQPLPELESGSTETILLSLIAAGSLAIVTLRAGADAYFAAVAVVLGVVGMAYLTALGWPVLAIGLILAACGALIYFSFPDDEASYYGLTLAAAGSVIAGVEVAFVVDDLASLPDWYRMNTIFKLYYQVWTMLALLAAVSLTVLVSRRSAAVTRWISTPGGFVATTEYEPAPRTAWARFGVIACAVLIGLSIVYPLVATAPRLEQRFAGHPRPGTLDSLDWMSYGTLTSANGEIIRFDGDLAAIRWFQKNVEGTPVIAEASIGPYRGDGSRFSIALGLPTVLGWERHERQQRYYPELAQRESDVHELYNTPDTARKQQIIERYGIEYIIVGDVERKTIWPADSGTPYASTAGLAALNAMVGTDLEIAFEGDGTTVYRVVRPNDQV